MLLFRALSLPPFRKYSRSKFAKPISFFFSSLRTCWFRSIWHSCFTSRSIADVFIKECSLRHVSTPSELGHIFVFVGTMPLPKFKSTAHLKASRSDDALNLIDQSTESQPKHYDVAKLPRFVARGIQLILGILLYSAMGGQTSTLADTHLEVVVLTGLFALGLLIAPGVGALLYFYPKYVKKPTKYVLIRETITDSILLVLGIILMSLTFAAGQCPPSHAGCNAWNMMIVVQVFGVCSFLYSLVWDVLGLRGPNEDSLSSIIAGMSNSRLRRSTRS